MVWGAALGAGAAALREFGVGPEAEARALVASTRTTDAFCDLYDTIDCYDITGMKTDASYWQMAKFFFAQGGSIRCFGMSARYAKVALRAVESVLGDSEFKMPAAVEGCTSRLARRLGASEEHAIMAAGLAGGIGLAGGGCGALGAAMWLRGVGEMERGGKVGYRSPEAAALIERFLPASNYEFECARIAGRSFEDLEDHAAWLDDGGCCAVLDVLAGEPVGVA